MDKSGITGERDWFGRPVAAVCIFAAAALLALFVIFGGEGGRKDSGGLVCMITQRHYGVDAREMERTIAIPLEDAFSSIPGIKNVLSFSENSRVRVYVHFAGDSGSRRIYDAVREAAQMVYETLPPSAQRPEFSSSDESGVPVWTAAIWNFPSGDYLQKNIKPVFEGIESVAEVDISGTGVREIIVAPDPEKTAALGIGNYEIAYALGMNDFVFAGGVIRSDTREIPVIVDGRFENTGSLGDALISHNGSYIRLRDIARVYETEREGDALSRLDGKQTAVISITASAGADLGALSRKINEKVNQISSGELEFRTLQDRGEEEAKSLRSVLIAALEASVLVAVTSFFLVGRRNIIPGLVSAACIPLVSIISAALLSCLNFPLDKKLLAGLSIGIGAAADAVLLAVNGFSKARVINGGKTLASVSVPLVSGAVTTLAALFPLASFPETGDIGVIAWALGIVTLVSLSAALLILPPILIYCNGLFKNSIQQKKIPIVNLIKRKAYRFLALLINIFTEKTLLVPAFSALIVIAALISLFVTGTDIAAVESENSVYARVEFDGGFRKEEGDKLLANWASSFIMNEGILAVQTSARTGSGQILVSFDPAMVKGGEVRSMLRRPEIPGGFVYLPEPSGDERSWEIKVFGDDDSVCRLLAEKAAGLCIGLQAVREIVLNFRDGNPGLVLYPVRDRLADSGLSFSAAADTIRRGIYGPVIYKRIENDMEVDVRLKLSDSSANGTVAVDFIPDDFYLRLPVIGTNSAGPDFIRADSLLYGINENEPSVIRREDRRRAASFSVRTGVMDPVRVKEQTSAVLKQLELPPGYVIEFDPEAIRQAEALSGTGFRIILALLFCYMVMAAINESFGFPLLILAAVPPSLAVPVLVMTLTGTAMNAVLACSLVAVSGMTVNASIITGAEFRRRKMVPGCSLQGYFYSVTRHCFPVLLATTCTTIMGAAPFVFLREGGNSMLRSLSLVTILGVSASWICSLLLIPSLYLLFQKKRPG